MSIRACVNTLVVALTFLTAPAPTSSAGQAPSEILATTDGFLVLVPLRDVADIQSDIEAADAELAQSARAVQEPKDLRAATRARIDAKKQEIADVKRHRDAAKGSGNEAEATALEAQRKALEREQELLEQRELLGASEIDLARRSGELATLVKRALEFERELMIKRNERMATGEPGPIASSLERVILDLEQKTLNAQITQADKKIEVASLEKRMADRRLKILEARRRVVVS